jgi:peroxiredoxin
MNKNTALILVVALLGLGGGIYLNQWLNKPEPTPATGLQTDHRPNFTLLDLQGTPRSISDWDGKVILVNFWATWCPPCVRELPALIKLHETYQDKGFTIIGIALDNKQDVIDFIKPMGLEYPILLGEQKGIKLTQAYGNRLGVLPYTVLIDRKGRILERHQSEISYEEAEALIKPLL